MKRYCQMLELVDDDELIRKYVEVHAHVWPEIMCPAKPNGRRMWRVIKDATLRLRRQPNGI